MKRALQTLLQKTLKTLNESFDLFCPSDLEVKIQRSYDKNHGDFVTSIACPLATYNRRSVHEIAHLIVTVWGCHPDVEKITVLSHGVICFFLSSGARARVIHDLLKKNMILSQPYDETLQYAYARTYGILQQLETAFLLEDEKFGLDHITLLTEQSEKDMMVSMACYMDASSNDSKLMCLKKLAHELQHYYNTTVLCCESRELRAARVCLLKAVCQVLSGDDGKKLHEKTIP